MVRGIWRRSIGERWRLTIPPVLEPDLGNPVFLQKNSDGHIEIIPARQDFGEDRLPVVQTVVAVERRKGRRAREYLHYRITIHPSLRDSASFRSGRSVVLISQRDKAIVLPRT